MRSSFLLLLLLPNPVVCFVPYDDRRNGPLFFSSSTYVGATSSKLEKELEDIWDQALPLGYNAAVRTTTACLKDRALQHKSLVVDRIYSNAHNKNNNHDDDNNKAHHDITEDAIEQAAAEFFGTSPNLTEQQQHHHLPFEIHYQDAIRKAEERFLIEASKAQIDFVATLRRTENTLEHALEQQQQHARTRMMMIDEKEEHDDILLERARSHFIRTTATAEILFQIALDKAELVFDEAKIRATTTRQKEKTYFEKNGQYMGTIDSYLSATFGDLIAF